MLSHHHARTTKPAAISVIAQHHFAAASHQKYLHQVAHACMLISSFELHAGRVHALHKTNLRLKINRAYSGVA